MKFTEIFEYIEDNLEEKLTIENVASFANYSSYHFQRMFAGAVGVSLGTYIRRRRLTKAALQLKDSSDRLIEIALEAGFETQESFTRSFKNMFGTTPNDFRKNQDFSKVRSMQELDLEFLQHIKNDGVNLEPEYVEKDGFTVIGIRKSFRQADSKIPELWDNLFSRINEIATIKSKEAFGLCEEIWEDGKIGDAFHYMAAIPVSENSIPPEGMEKKSIPNSKYAIFTHKGPLSTLDKTTRYIWGMWLPQSKKELNPTFDIEYYPSDFDPDAKETKIEIWMPIK